MFFLNGKIYIDMNTINSFLKLTDH